ncbi:unnamed protein product [Blumeria hordei]|uniref:Uncharacterized protein n=1 Tax=Blumeria hordei TaxID=2867405 RepID=A0A383UME9_BLUHO|nr:unnamed protein product [Blumeria hordei]
MAHISICSIAVNRSTYPPAVSAYSADNKRKLLARTRLRQATVRLAKAEAQPATMHQKKVDLKVVIDKWLSLRLHGNH